MTVSYTSYEAKVIEAAITMLADSTTFRTMVGAASPTEAKSKIIETDGGDPSESGQGKATACDGTTFTVKGSSYAQVACMSFPTDSPVLGWTKRDGEVMIGLIMLETAGDKPPERMRRAANVFGAIRDEIEAQAGGVGVLNAIPSLVIRPLPDLTSGKRATLQATITIPWSNY